MSQYGSETELIAAMRQAIEEAVPEATVDIRSGGGGHFAVVVTSNAFDGKRSLAKQRMVLGALARFMKGDGAPVHAIDNLQTLTPE
jgi:acid stress-induced BolA-like protein IbaG/YrbA